VRTAVDTNVLSAIWGCETNAGELARKLSDLRHKGSLVICGAVFAEALACPNASEVFLRDFLDRTGVEADFDLGEDVWTESGRRFTVDVGRRRSSSAVKTEDEVKRILADFIIGAHALRRADCLLTLDQRRYLRDFPELRLI